MDSFRSSAGGDARPTPGGQQRDADAAAADLSSIFNYPSLGHLFDGTDTRALESMRAQLTRTGQDLERVVRQGPKEDAERAARAARAVDVTLRFLADLDQLRREGGAR